MYTFFTKNPINFCTDFKSNFKIIIREFYRVFKFVFSGWNNNLKFPILPFLCFAKLKSATLLFLTECYNHLLDFYCLNNFLYILILNYPNVEPIHHVQPNHLKLVFYLLFIHVFY